MCTRLFMIMRKRTCTDRTIPGIFPEFFRSELEKVWVWLKTICEMHMQLCLVGSDTYRTYPNLPSCPQNRNVNVPSNQIHMQLGNKAARGFRSGTCRSACLARERVRHA